MTGRVAVVTDSSARTGDDILEKLGVRIVPHHLHLGENEFADGSLSTADLFARIDSSGSRPRTAAASPGEFLDAFRAERDAGAESIVCLLMSARYSVAVESARVAAGMLREESPDLPVEVVDTACVAAAHGLAVEAAAQAAAAGVSVRDVTDRARVVAASTVLVGVLETTAYLVRSGRVPWLVGRAADLLGVKPVIAYTGGRARLIGRARTVEDGAQRVASELVGKLSAPSRVAVMHAAAPREAERLTEEIRRRAEIEQLTMTEVTGVMAVHTGPGFVGAAGYPRGGEPLT